MADSGLKTKIEGISRGDETTREQEGDKGKLKSCILNDIC